MNKLENGTILYHGSYCIVDKIDLSKCHYGKDFGKGFYLTTSYEQAKKFVKLSVKNAFNIGRLEEAREFGYINSYELCFYERINEYDFQEADVEWLHFVAGNRSQELFGDLIKEFEKYNVIGGKIANDRTAATLNQYLNGTFGTPGDKAADDIAISLLLPNRLENQYCIRNADAIGCLRFQKAEEVRV